MIILGSVLLGSAMLAFCVLIFILIKFRHESNNEMLGVACVFLVAYALIAGFCGLGFLDQLKG